MPRLNLSRLPVIAVLLALLLVTACGKKGPLYLPDRPPPDHKQSSPAQP
jgi:predicted small lipoprotein YifL